MGHSIDSRLSSTHRVNQNSSSSISELSCAEKYWLKISQSDSFSQEQINLHHLPSNSPLKSLNPFIESNGLIHVGGRITNLNLWYTNIHPIFLHGKHLITKQLNILEPYVLVQLFSVHLLVSITILSIFDRLLEQFFGAVSLLNVLGGHHANERDSCQTYWQAFIALCLFTVSNSWSNASLVWSDHGTNFTGAKNKLSDVLHFLGVGKDAKTNIIFYSLSKLCT